MRKLLLVFLFLPFVVWGQSQNDIGQELRKLPWQVGPTQGRIGDKATINVPAEYVFLDEKSTRRFIELAGNPPVDKHYLFAPKSLQWFSVFTFNESGYVKDDEKIDPDALLKQLQDSDEPTNAERKKLGLVGLHTEGWQVPPHYDQQTKRLEWGVRLRDDSGAKNVNYTSRLLGRTGVMSAILVSDIDTLPTNTEEFRSGLAQFDYVSGEKYSEFKQGDKVAEYGLAALIVGGAAAVATKKGFWAVLGGFIAAFWKIVAGFAVAALAGVKSIFKRKKS